MKRTRNSGVVLAILLALSFSYGAYSAERTLGDQTPLPVSQGGRPVENALASTVPAPSLPVSPGTITVAPADAQSLAQMLSALQTEVTEQRVLLQSLMKTTESGHETASVGAAVALSDAATQAPAPVLVAPIATPAAPTPLVSQTVAQAQPVPTGGGLNSDADKRSYASGVSLAHELTQSLAVQKSLGITLDPTLVMEGLQDSFAQKPLRMDVGEVQALMSDLNADYFRRAKAQSDAAKVSGDKYRLAFAGQNGTFKQDSIWYKIYTPGSGRKLKSSDVVTVLLSGSLPDGTVFDNSGTLGNAKRVRVGALMPALSAGLQKIANGGHIVVVVPPAKGYGEMGLPPNIPGGATLIFDVTVQGVNEQEDAPAGQ